MTLRAFSSSCLTAWSRRWVSMSAQMQAVDTRPRARMIAPNATLRRQAMLWRWRVPILPSAGEDMGVRIYPFSKKMGVTPWVTGVVLSKRRPRNATSERRDEVDERVCADRLHEVVAEACLRASTYVLGSAVTRERDEDGR